MISNKSIRISRSIPEVPLVQVPLDGRCWFADYLRKVQLAGAGDLDVTGGRLQFIISNQRFEVEVHDEKIVFTLPPSEFDDLVRAIEEHSQFDIQQPLDHAFEPPGAKILPNGIQDVVFETYTNDDGKQCESH